ncbi:hypothetical protein LNKW23_37740 [Paralimibaculum aggregatum]|uniref:IstB-like ATP-binding protein domain-containing protein n=1 Tax=Paralimibaculum aggregatum TaxID=3036245 RepID=A0ABQ6LN08_9RHOB|nr:hypothetical protein [Limibaculum sp. NKW23]GMG84558.1 hypothetical protein LNKW23_37740 [Limibaculum sp. NKW23]
MEIVEDHYRAGSMLITNQLPVDALLAAIVLEDPRLRRDVPISADAVFDRLIHNTHRLPLDDPPIGKPVMRTWAEAANDPNRIAQKPAARDASPAPWCVCCAARGCLDGTARTLGQGGAG